MNFIKKEYEELFESVLEDSVEMGLISRAEEFKSFIANRQDISNYYIMDKSAIVYLLTKAYDDMELIYNAIDIEIATGIDLDNIGKIFGVPRPESSRASAEVTFTLHEPIEEDISIDEGFIVSTEEGIEYSTMEVLYIPAGGSSATVACLSVETGSDVKVSSNSLVNIVSSSPYSLHCTNEYASSGGNDDYTDDDYRELLSKWKLINVKGSDEAYENYFANFEGINGYKLVPNWNGTGTVKCILDPGTPYLLNKAYEELQDSVTQETEDITMFAPTKKSIDIYASVNVDIDQINPYSELEKENIKSRIITAIKVFIDEGYCNDGSWYNGLEIGEDFIPHKLAVFLDNEIPELKNINFTYPTDYIEIYDEEIGVSNNITIEMI